MTQETLSSDESNPNGGISAPVTETADESRPYGDDIYELEPETEFPVDINNIPTISRQALSEISAEIDKMLANGKTLEEVQEIVNDHLAQEYKVDMKYAKDGAAVMAIEGLEGALHPQAVSIDVNDFGTVVVRAKIVHEKHDNDRGDADADEELDEKNKLSEILNQFSDRVKTLEANMQLQLDEPIDSQMQIVEDIRRGIAQGWNLRDFIDRLAAMHSVYLRQQDVPQSSRLQHIGETKSELNKDGLVDGLDEDDRMSALKKLNYVRGKIDELETLVLSENANKAEIRNNIAEILSLHDRGELQYGEGRNKMNTLLGRLSELFGGERSARKSVVNAMRDLNE